MIRDTVKTTCPRDCYDCCGITVERENGRIKRVVGDRDHAIARGALCGKCALAYNGAWRNPAMRLSTPLKRVGPKGEGRFAPIGWEEALGTVAERWRGLIGAGRARSIIQTHYTGTVGLIGGWYPLRLFNRMGATEVDPDTVCNKTGHVTLETVFGNSLAGFDPRTVRDARTIMVWGANPSHSAPHQNRYWLKEASEAGATVIAIDPITHPTAAAADIHLKIAPGTDAALAFAMIHALRARGLADGAFLAAHVAGWEELLPGIDAMPPGRAAALCGVEADLIERAAIAYAAGPSLVWLGQGVQRQPRGGNVFRSIAALVAFAGQVGKPGAGFLYMNGPGGRGIDMEMVTEPSLARDGTGSISHMDLAATLERPDEAAAFVNWNNNPAASSPEQGRLRRALAREELFHVAVELFHTDTTAYADIVLPAASFLECDDLVLSYFDLTVSAQVKAEEPPGTALPNSEIFRRLAGAMGYDDPALFETDEALLGRLLATTPFRGSFADLAQVGTAELYPEPIVQFADRIFPTASGRIELAGESFAAEGMPRVPEPHADDRPAAGRLRVLSPASMWLMNSSYGNDPAVQRRMGQAKVTLHPADAAASGLAEGDPVVLANENGRVPYAVAISEAGMAGVALVHKGRWPNASGGDANVNALVSGRKSDVAESTAVHGTEARLERMLAAE